MPDLTVKGQIHPSHSNSPSLMGKQWVIKSGLDALNEIGSAHICKVCIANGGSCCNGCRHLANGVGCKKRNTSCTAWLCGYLKFLLYETGNLQQWNDYWEQVPGLDYRVDYTPEFVSIEKSLNLPNLQKLSEALAADLQELASVQVAIGFILTLQEKLDKYIDRLEDCKDDLEKQSILKMNIRMLSSPFRRFHKELQIHQQKPTL